jgi:hypothetical protein
MGIVCHKLRKGKKISPVDQPQIWCTIMAQIVAEGLNMSDSNQSIEWNKQKAYSGKLGLKRELFCRDYMKEKSKIIADLVESQKTEAESNHVSLTCRKQCKHSTCCMEYIEASIQECEVIVYYLFKHPEALDLFLRNYRGWQERVLLKGDISKECQQIYDEIASPVAQKNKWKMDELDKRYFDLHVRYFDYHIACPFLSNNECIIYDVRPYSCVCAYSCSPLDLCSINDKILPPINRSELPEGALYNALFYFEKLEIPSLFFMSPNIYEMMTKGYPRIADMAGMPELLKEAKRQGLVIDS